MRLSLCQINTTVGDYVGNAARIEAAVQAGLAAGATLHVFPELTLAGYPPRDLLDRPGFLHDGEAALQSLARRLPPETSVLVGCIDIDASHPTTSRLYNGAALLEGGEVVQRFHKRLLPAYDVFDETRYFNPGSIDLTFLHQGVRVGVTICEDGWHDVASPLPGHYQENPVLECVREGAEILVNLSASPFTLRKRNARSEMFASSARQHGLPLCVVNLVGANDDLVFDGHSTVFGPQGAVLAQAKRFEAQVLCCDVELRAAAHPPVEATQVSDASAALDALILGTRDYARKCGFKKAALGLSGGVDSALVAAIAAEALGPSNVLGVAMPTRYSSEGSLQDAQALVDALGIEYRVQSIEPMFENFSEQLTPLLTELGPAPERDTTFENMQARIRGMVLMSISNRLGHLLLTTGNKSEVAVGYCTLYGDMAGGLAVISDLPKTFVYEVCREANRRAGRELIPESILTKAPSAELRPDQTDQDSLPPYEVLDAILARMVEQGQSQADIVGAGFDSAVVSQVARLVRGSEYKRKQMPPGLIVTSKAFGPGRRYPIAQGYREVSVS